MTKANNLYLMNDGREIMLTKDEAPELNATLSPDGNFVAYTKGNNLYAFDIAGMKEQQLTQDGSALVLNGYASWVYMEEILGRSTNYKAFWWSPDSKSIAFFRSDDTNVPEVITTDADTTAGFTERIRYPRVAQKNPEIKVGIVSPAGGKIVWADFNAQDDQYFGRPYWKPDSKTLLVQWMNRLQDQLRIYAVDRNNGSKQLFYSEDQKTWIDLSHDRLSFINNNKNILIESDASGRNHIYLYDMNGKPVNAVTKGNFSVTKIEAIDNKKGWIYFSARGRESNARKDIYRASFNGKTLHRLTDGEMDNTFTNLSPDKKYLLYRASNTNTPTIYYSVSTDGNKRLMLYNSKDDKYDFGSLPKTEMITVRSDDGKFELPMKVSWPKNMEAGKKYPVLISIYGGPDAARTWDSWSMGKERIEYANAGLIQVEMEHRASGYFGKEGVNYMYHNLGDWELKDYATMVRWLIANGQADPARIGITGFSYGGYLTCLALTKYADVFTHGIAGGSVTDWQLYDSHYTERFMGTPANNPEGYKTSSVLNYTNNYKGRLLLVHGVIDENVHLVNTLALSAKLQDEMKDFDMMLYSGGRHGWRNLAKRWAHYEMLKRSFIYRNLLNKPMP